MTRRQGQIWGHLQYYSSPSLLSASSLPLSKFVLSSRPSHCLSLFCRSELGSLSTAIAHASRINVDVVGRNQYPFSFYSPTSSEYIAKLGVHFWSSNRFAGRWRVKWSST